MALTPEQALWHFFREVRQAVAAASRDDGAPPYRRGTHIVAARAGDVELTINDVSEEDAVLIAAELRELGVRAAIYASLICPNCRHRVPDQSYCVGCRARLASHPLPEAE